MATTKTVQASQAKWPGMAQFYNQQSVFITGATGFMGKCLVEKILRSLPDVSQIFILVRPKKGKSMRERIDALLKSKLFDKVRDENPEVLNKVIPLQGDITEKGLGLGEEDLKTIIENTSIVFHLAATIKFDAPLRESLIMNVVAVQELVKICKNMKNLKSFVHVSTAYSHCNRQNQVDEILYPPKIHPDKILGLLDWMTDEQLDAITPSLLDGRPNTYTFTKALAETVIVSEAEGLPLAIFRPTIVAGSYREPYPGWVDCIHGPTGIFVAVGKGLVRVMRGNENGIADLVPVDLVNNAILAVGWVTGVNPTPQPLLYHYTSGGNPIKWIELYPLVINSYMKYPFDEVFRLPGVYKCRPAALWKAWHFFFHLVPGFFADCMLRLQGKEPRMVSIYQKLNNALQQLDYFLFNSWNFTNTNVVKLYSIMSPEDQQTFDFDIRKLDWKEFTRVFCIGTKQYLFKEDPANIPVARKQINRLRRIHYTLNLIMILVASRLVYLRSSLARQLWNSMLGFCILMMSKLGVLPWSA